MMHRARVTDFQTTENTNLYMILHNGDNITSATTLN